MNSQGDIAQARILAQAIEAAIRSGEIRRFRSEVDEWDKTISRVQNSPEKDAMAMEALREAIGLAQQWLDFARKWTEERREELACRRQRHKTARKGIVAYAGTSATPSTFVNRRG